MDTFIRVSLSTLLAFGSFTIGVLLMDKNYLSVTDMRVSDFRKAKEDCEKNLTRLENCKIIYVKSNSGDANE
jgi:hypothetical protein